MGVVSPPIPRFAAGYDDYSFPPRPRARADNPHFPMSFAAARPASVPACIGAPASSRTRRAGAAPSRYALNTSSPRDRMRLTRTRASGVESVEAEEPVLLETPPVGYPVEEPEPPTPVSSSAAPPLACPVSLRPLDERGFAKSSGLQYAKTDGIWDLTIGAAINAKSPNPASLADLARSFLPKELRGLLPQSSYLGTSTFETPQVAFAYERGWRDSFKRAGFPGPDEEFQLAESKMLPFARDRPLLDASCGSGLFTRRFLKSGNYGGARTSLEPALAFLATTSYCTVGLGDCQVRSTVDCMNARTQPGNTYT